MTNHRFQDWAEGMDLAEHLRDDHGMPWSDAVKLFHTGRLVETHRFTHS